MNKDEASRSKFQEVSEAYEVLSDKDRRQQYDAVGMSGGQSYANGGSSGFSGFQSYQSSVDPDELFRRIFEQAGFGRTTSDFTSQPGSYAPRELQLDVDVTFQQAARGVNKEVSVSVTENCARCGGSRAEPGTRSEVCPSCNGSGMETLNTGPFVMRTTCRRCYGARRVNRHQCRACLGSGQQQVRQRIVIPVPAGVEDGQMLRVPLKQGQELWVTIKVCF